jgi:hypothetical protein
MEWQRYLNTNWRSPKPSGEPPCAVFGDAKHPNNRSWPHQKKAILYNADTRRVLTEYNNRKSQTLSSFLYRFCCTPQHDGLLFITYMLNHDSLGDASNCLHVDVIAKWIQQHERANNTRQAEITPRRVPLTIMNQVFTSLCQMMADPHGDTLREFTDGVATNDPIAPIQGMFGNFVYRHVDVFSPLMHDLVDELVANVVLPLNVQHATLPILVIVYYVGYVIVSSWQSPELWREWVGFWSLVVHPVHFNIKNPQCKILLARIAMGDRQSPPRWVMEHGLDIFGIFNHHCDVIGCISSSISNSKITHVSSNKRPRSCTPWARQQRQDLGSLFDHVDITDDSKLQSHIEMSSDCNWL